MAMANAHARVRTYIESLPPFLKVPNACELLQCSVAKLYVLMGNGAISAVKSEGTTLVNTTSCLNYLDNLAEARISPLLPRKRG